MTDPEQTTINRLRWPISLTNFHEDFMRLPSQLRERISRQFAGALLADQDGVLDTNDLFVHITIHERDNYRG